MSAGQVIGTAAAVVGVGFAGAVGWKIFESARTASQLNTAAGGIRAAGGDPRALDNLLAALRSEGVLSPGRKGSLVSQGTNEETRFQSLGVLDAAELAMLAAGGAAQLSPNLRVRGPRNDLSGWAGGMGPALSGEAERAGLASAPARNVRGLDMNAYALTYLTDAWPETDPYGHEIIAVPKSTPAWLVDAWVIARGRGNPSRDFMIFRRMAATFNSGPKTFDIFITSKAQGGVIAFWDRARSKFLTPAEATDVKLVILLKKGGWGALASNTPGGQNLSGSAFIWALYQSLRGRTVFQPFPPKAGA